jgi:hypothetical protein
MADAERVLEMRPSAKLRGLAVAERIQRRDTQITIRCIFLAASETESASRAWRIQPLECFGGTAGGKESAGNGVPKGVFEAAGAGRRNKCVNVLIEVRKER